ncbi:MAG: M3 family oligoendopeptidase [Chloroflexi bacterium]|nr:M3 family oligoendopeptidase [Chloroflexota bacterium]
MVGEASTAQDISWDLSDLFSGPDDPRINEELAWLQQEAESLAATYRGKIAVPGGPIPEALLTALQRFESWSERANRVAGYPALLSASDTTNHLYRQLEARIDEQMTMLTNIILFFDLEWRMLADADAEALMAHPLLEHYEHYLRRERQFKPHTLSEPEEKLLNEKQLTASQAWQRLFDEQVSAMTYHLEWQGEARELTQSAILSLLYSPERELRKQAHEVFYNTLEPKAPLLTYVYETLVQDKLINDRLRSFSSPMASRHLANEVDGAAVDAMMRVVEEHYPLAHEYFQLKGDLLGVRPLKIYDQYAPLSHDQTKVSYSEAREIILTALAVASPDMMSMARRFFDQLWIDADPRRGKRGGAFCMGISPKIHPYVLCNYTDTARDVMTVAHELGHGLHDILASEQSMFNYYPVLPLAETASVFSEMLTFDLLAQRENDPRRRLALVGGKVEEIFATVFRQNVLTRFEQSVFEARKQGRFTAEQLADLWIAANHPYYGQSVELTDEYRLGWSYIPHFIHTPFYCYAYVFGELLVLSLYAMYHSEGEAFIPRYLSILRAGGSQPPDHILKPLGIDIKDPAFWRQGFFELRRMIGWVRGLVTEISSVDS